MKNLFKLLLLAIITIFAFNIGYVYAEEQESEKSEERIEEVLEPAISDIVNISDNKSEEKEETTVPVEKVETSVEKEEVQVPVEKELTSETTTESEEATSEPTRVADNPTGADIEEPTIDETKTTIETSESQTEEVEESVQVVKAPILKAATPTYKLTVIYNDTRLSGLETLTKTYNSNSTNSSIRMNAYLGLSTTTTDYINEVDDQGKATGYSYVFAGWFTSDGRKISYEDNTDVDSVQFKIYNKTQYSTLNIVVPELEENKEISLYARWTKVYKPTVVIHFYDTKRFNENKEVLTSEIDTTNRSKQLNLKTTQSTGRRDLDQMFIADNVYSAFSYTGPYDKNQMANAIKIASIGHNYFKFIKYVDENGTTVDENYVDPKGVISSVNIIDKKIGNSYKYKSIEIIYKSAMDANLQEDVDIHIYAVFEGHTSASLTNKYIDEVSTGSGSFSETNQGLIEYTHTFSDPSKKTPTPHHKFLYWQYENPTQEDDQVDPTKEYKDGDSITYDLFNKPENWDATIIAHAWWQPDVTLNLYSDGKLLSTQSSFESVTIDTTPTKYGYEFLGWVDEKGNTVDETTFTPNDKGTKPEPKTVNLYASWKRIMVDVKVTKTWDDSDNNDGIRPDSVTIELKNGDEVVKTEELNEDNKWTITFNVPKYDDTKEIQYSVNEKEIEGYSSNITGSIKEGFTVTNTHEVETIKSIAVKKVWDDNNDEDEIRPESITVYLLGNGEKVQEVVLSEKNNWESTFENVNVYDGGKEIEYTVSEEEIEFYEVTVDGNKKDGFTVTNYHEPWPKGDGDEPEEPTNEDNNKNNNNPKTGDDIVTNIIMLLMSLTGLASGIIYLNKNKLAKNN